VIPFKKKKVDVLYDIVDKNASKYWVLLEVSLLQRNSSDLFHDCTDNHLSLEFDGIDRDIIV